MFLIFTFLNLGGTTINIRPIYIGRFFIFKENNMVNNLDKVKQKFNEKLGSVNNEEELENLKVEF